MSAGPIKASSQASRPRDAAASKRALLGAAQSLFGQRGFEATTIRDIGDQAGVDAALIARYYGSKADLYIAAVVAEGQGDQPAAAFEGLADLAEAIVARTEQQGLGPVTQALIRSDTPQEIREAAHAHLVRRMVAAGGRRPDPAGGRGPSCGPRSWRPHCWASTWAGLSGGSPSYRRCPKMSWSSSSPPCSTHDPTSTLDKPEPNPLTPAAAAKPARRRG